jgi:hypothetical protein
MQHFSPGLPVKPRNRPQILDRARAIAASLKGIYAGAFCALLCAVMLDLASRLHWALGAAFAGLLVSLTVWLTYHVERDSDGVKTKDVLAVLAWSIFTVTAVAAWISFTLCKNGLGDYSGVPAEYSPGSFFNLYVYTFLDLLPAMKALETLHIKAPIEPRTLVAGLPVLAFRLFVVGLFFRAILSWLKANRSSSSPSQGPSTSATRPSQAIQRTALRSDA